MKQSFLYTIIVEFRKGSYVSQVKSNTVREALKKWLQDIDPEEIKHLGKKTLDSIKIGFETNGYDKPTKLRGMRNVWFVMLLSGREVSS